MKSVRFVGVICLLIIIQITYGAEKVEEEPLKEPNLPKTGAKSTEEPTPSSSSDTEGSKSDQSSTNSENESSGNEDKSYALGSLCNYCSYCKFCQLCDKDCPCKSSKAKPNCHLCKYCKYCSMCSVCDTVCTPGGIVDLVSSAIYNSLPTFDKETKESVDKDIESARKWIKEYL